MFIVWRRFSVLGLSPLIQLKGTLSVSVHKDVLDNFMQPTLRGTAWGWCQHGCTSIPVDWPWRSTFWIQVHVAANINSGFVYKDPDNHDYSTGFTLWLTFIVICTPVNRSVGNVLFCQWRRWKGAAIKLTFPPSLDANNILKDCDHYLSSFCGFLVVPL